MTRYTSDIAPRIHNLVELAARAGLTLDKRERNILQKTNKFNIRGRYGGPSRRPLVMREAKLCIAQSEEVFQWLLEQL